MTAPTLLHPSSESVAVAWLSSWFPVGVATTLPRPGTWPTYSGSIQGFATVTIVGGALRRGATHDTALRSPVVSLGTWAAIPGSDNPQWGAAVQLAEGLTHLAQDGTFVPTLVRPSMKYAPAFVHDIRLNAEPRRVPDQDESMAHFETEFVLMWTEYPA